MRLGLKRDIKYCTKRRGFGKISDPIAFLSSSFPSAPSFLLQTWLLILILYLASPFFLSGMDPRMSSFRDALTPSLSALVPKYFHLVIAAQPSRSGAYSHSFST
jgi:hypothetical protein